MIHQSNGRALECVLIDLNTQHDFCLPDGAHPVANLPELLPALRRVIAWTKRNHAPVVSAIGSHRPREYADGNSSTCCIDGSEGQRKIDFTVLAQRTYVEVDNTLSVPLDLFGTYQQIIFRERTGDLLANPKADRFLTQIPTREFIIFGTVLELTVKAVTLGLLSRKKPVTVIADACGYWNGATADLALRQMMTKGAGIISVDQLLFRRLSRRHRYVPSTKRHSRSNGRPRSGRSLPRANRSPFPPPKGSSDHRATPSHGGA